MKLIFLKMQCLFHLLHYIKDDGATVIMHKSGEHSFFEPWQMQGRKFFAALKPVFVNSTFIICKKMAGNRIQDHHAIAAFFEVFIVEGFPGHLQVPGKIVCFLFIDVYHQGFAAVAATGAIDIW